MLSTERRRTHRSMLQAPKITNMLKHSILGTLSPETSITTSSGYSTGGSSVSTTRNTSSKKPSPSIASKQQHQQQHEQYDAKSKGFHHLFSKLKNFLVPSKSKHTRRVRVMNSRQISSTNILRQYHQQSTIYDVLPSSLVASNTISLPFTYYQDSPIQQSKTTYDKISAWLDQQAKITQTELDHQDLPYIHDNQQQSTTYTDSKVISTVMRQTPTNIKPPRRSSSLVARITRPIVEHQAEKSLSPSSSFSSSILTKGMTERMTPSPTAPQIFDKRSLKSNRRRTMDFSQRQSTIDVDKHKSNKENQSLKHTDKSLPGVYQFPPFSSTNKNEMSFQSAKHVVAKKYYFHSNPTKSVDEDLLNNSYGLTLLNQQQQQQQPQQPRPRRSVGAVLMISQVPNQVSSQKSVHPHQRTSIPQQTMDSLDDLLCDREVESYFYPIPQSTSDHVYMNLDNPSDSCSTSLSCIHGTLC
ncbi:unnamed protein product [Adineta ricciae]|uniref:Uncharacterized protein n=1 Tax=Adineta ricciae TaxID=249248 RepID=A0A814PI64_ADIRI|nr:unnamed protein product [Adineta ricciae]